MLRILVSRFGVVVALAALLWLIVSGSFLSPAPLVIAGQLVAVALAVWARRTFAGSEFRAGADPGSGPLLTVGPYRCIRHPMFTAALLLVWASILGHWSLVNGAIGAVVTATIALRIPAEEALLRSRYPEYGAYAERTRRLVPFLL
jgi:protein-S-isoprenylcysteine O-methyltransferase Ste14